MGEMIETLQNLMNKFNEKAEKDEEFKNYWKDKERSIQISFIDNQDYSFHLRDAKLKDLKPEKISNPDIIITTDTETFNALVEKRMGAMKAYALKKVRIKASLEDIMAIRKFL